MTFTAADRYKMSVVYVALTLHSEHTGANQYVSGPASRQDIVIMVAWLQWRITEGWTELGDKNSLFDAGVKLMAAAALAEGVELIGSWQIDDPADNAVLS